MLGTNFVLGAAVLAYVLHGFGSQALGLLARGPNPVRLAGFLLAVVAAFAGYALRWRVVLEGLAVRPPLPSLIAYRAIGQSISSLVPSAKLGGDPVRALLLAGPTVPIASAIASVLVDRTLEMGANAPLAVAYATVLLRHGVSGLERALLTVLLALGALVAGVIVVVRRLRRRAGLLTAIARSIGLDRLRGVRDRMDVLATAEADIERLVREPRRLARAFAIGVVVDLVVLLEFHLLLSAFGLPAGPLAVVAAVFATGAAHSLPVPAALGALEGAQMWLFGMLGQPPEVGLAVGLAVRARELVWIAPGLVCVALRGWSGWARGLTPERRFWL